MNKVISKLLLELLQDLENTQTYIHGYWVLQNNKKHFGWK